MQAAVFEPLLWVLEGSVQVSDARGETLLTTERCRINRAEPTEGHSSGGIHGGYELWMSGWLETASSLDVYCNFVDVDKLKRIRRGSLRSGVRGKRRERGKLDNADPW